MFAHEPLDTGLTHLPSGMTQSFAASAASNETWEVGISGFTNGSRGWQVVAKEDFTYALGYPYSEDPNFMYCAEDMTIESSYGDC